MAGKIIAVIGAQASGKSTLVRQLAQGVPHAQGFYEGEQFPAYVTHAFEHEAVRIRAFLYFHTLWLRQYAAAQQLKAQGRVALLDAFWLTNLFYLDALKNTHERQLIDDMVHATAATLSPPNGVIYLDVSDALMAQRVKARAAGGARDWELAQGWLAEAQAVRQRHLALLANPQAMAKLLPQVPVLAVPAQAPDLQQQAMAFIQEV